MHGRIIRGVALPCFILLAAKIDVATTRAATTSTAGPPDAAGLITDPFGAFALSPVADCLQFTAPRFTVSESGVTAAVSVMRTGDASNTVSVVVSTIAGGTAATVDYTPESSRLTFGPGEREGRFEFFVRGNSLLDGSRTVLVGLSEPSGGAQLGARTKTTVTILDDEMEDVGRFVLSADAVARESDGTIAVTIHRVDGSRGTASVDLQFASMTTLDHPVTRSATSHVMFAEGEPTQRVCIEEWESGTASAEALVRLVLFNPTAGAACEGQAQIVQLPQMQAYVLQLAAKP